MGKKKRSHPDIEEILARPWCFYCERDFDDLKILISHQKAKHYKCDRCNRRLNTAGGLSVHLNQVHKENLTAVENALPNRAAPDIEIFGMEGIPEDVLAAHNARISEQFFAAEAQRRAISGNYGGGGSGGGGNGNNAGGSSVKKAKFESPAEIKARLAAHKAKKAAEAAGGGSVSSDPNTPAQIETPPPPQPIAQLAAVAPPSHPTPPFPQPYGAPATSAQPSFPQYYGSQPPPFNYDGAFGAAPPIPPPGAFPPGQFPQQPQFSPAPQHYGDPSGAPSFAPPYQPHQGHHHTPVPHHGPPSASPFNQYNPRLPRPSPPSQPQTQPARQNSLPAAPGLPARPSFNAPHVSREQLAEMHHGNLNAAGEAQLNQSALHTSANASNGNGNGSGNGSGNGNGNVQSVDDLISSAAQLSSQTPVPQTPVAATPTPAPEKPATAEKKTEGESKKAKKPLRLVYTSEETSPEEKLAHLSLYSFTPDTRQETILAPIGEDEGNVTGPVMDSDTVLDPSG